MSPLFNHIIIYNPRSSVYTNLIEYYFKKLNKFLTKFFLNNYFYYKEN